MKRAGNLFPRIAEPENLALAFWKAQRGKSGKAEVIDFRSRLGENLATMRNEFLSGDVKLGDYHYFTIHDPKERVICAASFRERVIQHAVINVCEPYFEKYQISDSYACRKGKGVDACLERAKYFCRKSQWFLKLDIHKYFDSIDHEILFKLLSRRFKDVELLKFFQQLLDTYEVLPGRGIPIGNLASQYFANLYLGLLDHELKEERHVNHYLRYMDDFILFADDKKELQRHETEIRAFLSEKLHLDLNAVILNRTSHGVPFLSYKVLGGGLRLSQKSKHRFRLKMTSALAEESAERALPLLAFINRANSMGFRRSFFYGDSSNGSNRVNRGGSWNNNARNCRSTNRNNNSPDNRNNNLGFRVALRPAQGSDGCSFIEPDVSPVPGDGTKKEGYRSPVEKSTAIGIRFMQFLCFLLCFIYF